MKILIVVIHVSFEVIPFSNEFGVQLGLHLFRAFWLSTGLLVATFTMVVLVRRVGLELRCTLIDTCQFFVLYHSSYQGWLTGEILKINSFRLKVLGVVV